MSVQQLHLGLGQFFRGHLAVYTQKSRDDWNIAAVSMRTDTSVKQMKAQENRYHVLSRDKDDSEYLEIDCVKESLFLHNDYSRILEILSHEDLQIISLTITEKGYCFDFNSKKLDTHNKDINADLKNEKKVSAIGLIALALDIRYKTHQKPITLLSSDNVSFNGDVLQKAIESYLELSGSKALTWFREKISCPNSMVDRIIPKTSEEQKRKALDSNPFDPLVILTESFTQWCIEDKFSSARPEWPGVEWVKNIEPFEDLKLRTLNGSHTYLTYLGRLKNYDYVHEAIQDREIRDDIEELYLNEVYPTLKEIEKSFFMNYKSQLIERFENPHLNHQLEQIAMDGSQKIPQRWIPVWRENSQSPIILQGLCHWAIFLYRKLKNDEQVFDPLTFELTETPREFLNQLTSVIPQEVLTDEKFLKVYDERCQRFL